MTKDDVLNRIREGLLKFGVYHDDLELMVQAIERELYKPTEQDAFWDDFDLDEIVRFIREIRNKDMDEDIKLGGTD